MCTSSRSTAKTVLSLFNDDLSIYKFYSDSKECFVTCEAHDNATTQDRATQRKMMENNIRLMDTVTALMQTGTKVPLGCDTRTV